MAVGDVYRLSVQGIIGSNNDLVVNVFHYEVVDDPVGDPVEDLIDAWIADGQTLYLACITNQYGLNKFSVQQVIGGSAVGERSVTLAPGTRTGTGALPFQVAPIITWRTGQAGRSKRGRSYMPPPDEADSVGGSVQSGLATALTAFANGVLDIGQTVISDEWRLVVYSPTLGTAQDVTSFTVQQVMGTVRRRRQGVGA